MVRGAETAVGSRDISTNIDFSTSNAGFRLNVSGVERDILVNTDSGDNVADIQAALDAAYGAGVVTAAMDGTGLKLSTVATGTDEYIEVLSDGKGATSSTFADISTGMTSVPRVKMPPLRWPLTVSISMSTSTETARWVAVMQNPT